MACQLARVVLEYDNIFELALVINSELRRQISHGCILSLLDFLFESIELRLRWLNHVLFILFVFSVESFIEWCGLSLALTLSLLLLADNDVLFRGCLFVYLHFLLFLIYDFNYCFSRP